MHPCFFYRPSSGILYTFVHLCLVFILSCIAKCKQSWVEAEERNDIRSERKVKSLNELVEEQRDKLKHVEDDRITKRITEHRSRLVTAKEGVDT